MNLSAFWHHGFTWTHSDSLGFTWTHFDSLGFTWTHLDSPGFNWNHLDSPGCTWTGSTRIHFDSLGFRRTTLQLTRSHISLTKGKGKVPFADLTTGPRMHACDRTERISRLVSLPRTPILNTCLFDLIWLII